MSGIMDYANVWSPAVLGAGALGGGIYTLARYAKVPEMTREAVKNARSALHFTHELTTCIGAQDYYKRNPTQTSLEKLQELSEKRPEHFRNYFGKVTTRRGLGLLALSLVFAIATYKEFRKLPVGVQTNQEK